MRTAPWSLLLPLVVLASACSERGLGSGETGRECWDLWDCNPGRLCGELVDCVHFRCLRDASPVLVPCPGDECVRDDDCVLALPYDCCNGCPTVLPRDALDEYPCHYAADEPPGTPPVGCNVDCLLCPDCFPQPLAVRCELGRCVSPETGCPSSLDATPPEVDTSALLLTPDVYDGAEVLLTGTLLPGPLSCLDDCPAGELCCSSTPTLDGVVSLQGPLCDLDLTLWSTSECADAYDAAGPKAGATYAVAGRLRRTGIPEVPFELAAAGLWLEDPHGIEGAFDYTVVDVQSDALDPSCLPPTLAVGSPGRLYLAESDGRVVAVAPGLDCWPRFVGSSPAPGRISTRAPVYCDTCCCDYTLSGEVAGSRFFGEYEFFDGVCRYRYLLEGVRDPLAQPLPPPDGVLF